MKKWPTGPVAPVFQLVTSKPSDVDASSNLCAVTGTGIFPHKKKKSNRWRTIKSLVHEIRLHGRRGRIVAEYFSRVKLRQSPQKEGGKILCDLPPV